MTATEYKENINTYFDNFLQKSTDKLNVFFEDGDLSGEDKANVISSVLNSAMSQSLQATISITQVNMNTMQLELEKRLKPFKLDGARIDVNTKEQRYFTEQLKNGGVSFTYVFYRSYFDKEGNKVETDIIDEDYITIGDETFILFRDYKRVASKTINEGNSLSTVELQNLKTIEDTNYIKTQAQQLIDSVIYNNKIKAGESLADLFGTLGAGGLVIPDDGWNAIFSIVNELAGTSVNSAGFQDGVTKL